jgi:5-methylcytosine-specific restriction endonuclease McrA
MISLDPPDCTALDAFTTCISRIQDLGLRKRLASVTQIVVDASAAYAIAAGLSELHQIATQTMLGVTVSRAEMEAVYTYRMARNGAPGRPIYDALLSSAPQGRCPLCAHRIVSTLDHHLPKARHPALAVVPLNLVPACSDCNKSKLAYLATTSSEEPLHPYFDDIDADTWLRAEVIEELPAATRFFVEEPPHWDETLASRVRRHFRHLGLAQLYAAEAADELLNIRHQLGSLHGTGGLTLVRAELQDRAASCRQARRNGWRTAAFEAFAKSDWFCDGGFS